MFKFHSVFIYCRHVTSSACNCYPLCGPAGARQVVSQLVTAMGVQRSDWVCCSDVQQLQEAVASVRQQQQQQQEDAHKLLPPQLQQVGHVLASLQHVTLGKCLDAH